MEATSYKGILLTANDKLRDRILSFYPESFITWSVYTSGNSAVQSILSVLPDIVVLTDDLDDLSVVTLVSLIKGENIYRQVSTLLCLPEEQKEQLTSLSTLEVDDFFVLPGNDTELKARLELTMLRSHRSFDANPLSHLPGNTSIIRYVQGLIDSKQDFSMGYCDLDHFKAFNDKYGFARGDEILLMTARLVLNTIRATSPDKHFVGHVGGDDFIFVVPVDKAATACTSLIQSFDSIVPQFYDDDDRQRGGIVSTDRRGTICSFPMMAISIAVVHNCNGSIKHMAEASQTASNLKKKAKENIASSYVIDRRSASLCE